VDASSVSNVDRLDNCPIEEDGWYRPNTEGTKSESSSGGRPAREGEQIRGIQHRAGKKCMDGAETNNTRAVDVPVNSRCEPRRDALDARDTNIASASTNDIPNARRHNERPYRKTDSTPQEISDRCQLISGDEHGASERAEDGSV
jgi:hypothetical protein